MPYSITDQSGAQYTIDQLKTLVQGGQVLPRGIDFSQYAALAAITDPKGISVSTFVKPATGGVYVSQPNNSTQFISGDGPISTNLLPDNGYTSITQELAAQMPSIPQTSAAATSATSGNVPYLTSIQNILAENKIHLTKVQSKALSIGLGLAAGTIAAVGAYKALKHRTATSRRHSRSRSLPRSTRSKRRVARRSSTRRKRAHLVKGSMAAKRHMARLRRMRKR